MYSGSHKLPVVGANYRRRHASVFPSAVRRDGAGVWEMVHTTPEKARVDLVEDVDRLGFGLLLMEVAAVAQALGEQPYPLFETRSLPDGEFIGEDSLFCDRLRAGGLKIHVDHTLSIKVGHLHEVDLMFPGA